MTRIGNYELLTEIAERPPWRFYVAQTIAEGSPYRSAPERFLIRAFDGDRTDVLTLQLVDESRLALFSRHTNIERALEQIDHGFAWVSEYFEGWSIEHVIEAARDQGRSLSIQSACSIAAEVCRGLHYLHHEARGDDGKIFKIMHRTIGPATVRVTSDGTVKLTNPGLDLLDVLSRGAVERSPSLEELARMSPEHAWGKALEPRSDVYMVGAFLYELVTGEPCFRCDSAFDMIRAIRELFVPPPSSLRGETPKSLDAVILRALAKDPNDRQPTAGELAWNLELVMKTLGWDDGQQTLLDDLDALGLGDHCRPGGL